MLNAVAQAPFIQSVRNPECTEYLSRLGGQTPSATVVLLFDTRGNPICGPAGDEVNIADRPYFKAALATHEFVVGEYMVGKVSGQPVLPFALRVTTSDGETLGVMVTTLQLAWLRQYFAEKSADFPPTSSITILDQTGTILVRLPDGEQEGSKLAHHSELLSTRSGGATLRPAAGNTADGIARFVGYTALNDTPRGTVVAVGLPQSEVLAGVQEARIRAFLLMTVALVLVVGAARFGGRAFILRPVNELLQVTERWRVGDFKARASIAGSGTELDRLGWAFNSMADELQAAMGHKDMLLRELSHRVMNSLQTLGALFRLQARDLRDPQARAQFDQAVARIHSMALAYRRLHTADGVEVVDFAEFLRELCQNLQSSMAGEGNPILVEADLILLGPDQAMPLALVVNELVTNAIKHGTREAGGITVKLGRSKQGCRLAVRNAGSLPAGYDPSETTGFGMRMVCLTVAQLGGRLEASSMAGETEFTVTFQPKRLPPAMLAAIEPRESKNSDCLKLGA